MTKRWLAPLTGLALVLGTIAPAGAAVASIALSTSGPSRDQPTAAPAVSGSVTAANGCVVDSIAMAVSTPESHPVPGNRSIEGNGEGTQSFSWNPDLPQNGRYVVTVEAVQRPAPGAVLPECTGTASKQADLWVEGTSAPVQITKTIADTNRRTVTISWKRNTESDLIGYLVYRALGSDDSEPVYGVDQPGSGSLTFLDDLSDLPGGSYEYSITALRPSADWYQSDRRRPPVASPDSSSSNTSATMPPQTKPVTTTTSGAGGTSGSGSSSGGGIRSTGRVNFGAFAAELNSARRTTATTEYDPGYDEKLGYKDKNLVIRDGESAAPTLPDGDQEERPTNLLLVATALLILAVAAHLLWLRQEVARVPLEPVAPSGAEPAPAPEFLAPPVAGPSEGLPEAEPTPPASRRRRVRT